eukprot:c27525_g1_i1.p1 GENE.c27525_g1_i1~~c27525_g1_i1.p1  ORF type:complete len:301 (+),score=42.45 c27525_g1_i1:41-943(+)
MPSPSVHLSVTLWFAFSVVCTTTSKQATTILSSSLAVTLAQMLVSSGLSYVFARASSKIPSLSFTHDDALIAVVFTLGFLSLNLSLELMPVSMAMTFRALEPLYSATLVYFLKHDNNIFQISSLASLSVVVIGASLSSFQDVNYSTGGLLAVLFSNLMFALRGFLSKKNHVDPLIEFFRVSTISSILLVCLFGLSNTPIPTVTSTNNVFIVFVNAASFFAYSQLSWNVLASVDAVTHSVLNTLRRPVVILCSVLIFQESATPSGIAGSVLACLGTLAYTLSQAKPKTTGLTQDTGMKRPK